MSTAPDSTFGNVWNEVRVWPQSRKLALAAKILESVHDESQERPAGPRRNLSDLVGLAATDASPPADEEVERILEEERLKKYG